MSPIKQSSSKSPGKPTASELKRANRAAGLLTTIFGQSLATTTDPSQQQRLLTVLLQIIATDAMHPPGQRIVPAGDVCLLEGFEFCTHYPLQKELPLQPDVLLDRQKGYCIVHIPPILLSALPKKRGTFTHFWPSAEVVAVDFEHDTARSFATATVPQALDTPAPLNLFIPYSAAGQATLIVAVGLRFLKEEDGTLYEMKQCKEPLKIVKVDAGSRSGVQRRESVVSNQEPEAAGREGKVVNLNPESSQSVPCRQGGKINVVPLKALLDSKPIKKTASQKKSKGRKAVPK